MEIKREYLFKILEYAEKIEKTVQVRSVAKSANIRESEANYILNRISDRPDPLIIVEKENNGSLGLSGLTFTGHCFLQKMRNNPYY